MGQACSRSRRRPSPAVAVAFVDGSGAVAELSVNTSPVEAGIDSDPATTLPSWRV
jgi:hypothetical protein